MFAMAALAIIAILFLAIFLRTIFFVLKILFFVIGTISVVEIAFMLAHAATAASRHAGVFMHDHAPQIALAIAGVATVAALAVVGAKRAWRYVQLRLEPFAIERRLRRAAATLKRSRLPVTPSALANAAQIDVDSSLSWLTRNPRFMPSALHVPAWK